MAGRIRNYRCEWQLGGKGVVRRVEDKGREGGQVTSRRPLVVPASSVVPGIVVREREREKGKKIRRREWNRFDRFRFRRARTTSFFVLPSPSLSLSAPSWPRFPTVAPLITPPLPPPPGRSPPAAPVFDSIRFRGVARGCPVASDAETWPSGKRWWPRRFWIGYSPSSLGKNWFRGLRGD